VAGRLRQQNESKYDLSIHLSRFAHGLRRWRVDQRRKDVFFSVYERNGAAAPVARERFSSLGVFSGCRDLCFRLGTRASVSAAGDFPVARMARNFFCAMAARVSHPSIFQLHGRRRQVINKDIRHNGSLDPVIVDGAPYAAGREYDTINSAAPPPQESFSRCESPGRQAEAASPASQLDLITVSTWRSAKKMALMPSGLAESRTAAEFGQPTIVAMTKDTLTRRSSR